MAIVSRLLGVVGLGVVWQYQRNGGNRLFDRREAMNVVLCDVNRDEEPMERRGLFEVVFGEIRAAWESTKDVDHRRISLTVAKTLSSLQNRMINSQEEMEGSDKTMHQWTRALAGSFFITLMLEHAASGKASKEFRKETADYVTSVMKERDIAAVFLSTPGNVARLFQAMEIQDDKGHLGEQMWNSMKNTEDIVLESISKTDLDIIIGNMGLYRQNECQRRIALRMFRWWCQHGGVEETDRKILRRSIDCISTASNTVSGNDAWSQMDIVKSMRCMIDFLPADVAHQTLPWMWPLLCFAADGVGGEQWDLVNESLDVFTACMERGVCPSPDLIEKSALPLLYSVSRDVPVNRLDVGVRLAECIGALARSETSMSYLQKKTWTELFTSWLIRLDPRKADILTSSTSIIEAKALSESIVDALASLSATSGIEGLQIAHLWLADVIIHLSRMATPYSDVNPQSSANLEQKSSWWKWVPFVQKSKEPCNDSLQETEIIEEEAQAVADLAEKMLGNSGSVANTQPQADEARPWWKYYLYPWKSDPDGPSESKIEQREETIGASDSELALYINASPIGPVYARSMARRLLEASGNVFNTETDLSHSLDENMSPLTAASYSAAAATVNKEVADNAVAQALKVLSALASGDAESRSWLLLAGLPRLLQVLAQTKGTEVAGDTTGRYSIPVKLQRQISRILALLSIDVDGAESIVRHQFIPWLQHLAASDDCKVSSNAARALLHIEAAQRSGFVVTLSSQKNLLDASRMMSNEDSETVLPEVHDLGLGQQSGKRLMSLNLGDKQELFVKQKRKEKLWMNLSADRLILHDGIHLFSPLAKHHEVLAQQGTHDTSPGSPSYDIVFVHGIRGGAFITWRQEKALSLGSARGNVDHSVCWPTAWLAPKFPKARLISAEYAAPATWWEGESLPLYGTVNHLAEKLVAAGIGSRPVIFVCHSMGGVIVKEIIGRGTMKDAPQSLRKISKSAAGVVFYSVPHAGSRLADLGWKLRYLGASPSRAVAHLKTDPHLHEVNSVIRDLCRRDKLRVLSFSEGLPTKLSYVSTHIVPHESAYPGYGEFIVLGNHDHITVCKPQGTEDLAFKSLVHFLSKLEDKILN
jgi:hypothetical protein